MKKDGEHKETDEVQTRKEWQSTRKGNGRKASKQIRIHMTDIYIGAHGGHETHRFQLHALEGLESSPKGRLCLLQLRARAATSLGLFGVPVQLVGWGLPKGGLSGLYRPILTR